jgi:putative membrane protein
MLLGSVNILVLALSFVTLFSINKSRTGSAAAISEILRTFDASSLAIILLTILISSLISFFLTIYLAGFFSEKIRNINYSKLSIIILIFLSLVVLFFSGFLGFLVYIVSTFTGLTAIYAETRRTHLMGSMMLTAILFYLPI